MNAHRRRKPRVAPARSKNRKRNIVAKLDKAQTTIRYQPPFGTSFRTRLTYAQYVDFSLSVANTAYMYQFNANSVYDPDRTGAGHQPYGHDQLAFIFNRYRVMKSSYLIEVVPGNDVSNSNIEWGAGYRNGTYTVAYPDVYEMPFVKTAVLTNNSDPKKLRGRANLETINERPIAYISDDRTSALCTANPAEVILLNFFAISNQANVQRVRVTIWYDVEYFDPYPLGSSIPAEVKAFFDEKPAQMKFSQRVQAFPMPVNPNYKSPPLLNKNDWDKKGNPRVENDSD